MKNSLLKHYSINLQMFAEGDPDPKPGQEPNPQDPPKQNKYSDEEYEKLKANFDKTSSEIAELKKQLKSKQSDEEKKAEEEKAKQEEFVSMQNELKTLKLQKKLTGAFEEAEVNDLSALLIEGDVDKLADKLVAMRNAFKTKIYEEAKKEFQKSATLPGGSGGGEETPAVIKDLLAQKQKGGKTDARDYWLGKKEEK